VFISLQNPGLVRQIMPSLALAYMCPTTAASQLNSSTLRTLYELSTSLMNFTKDVDEFSNKTRQ